MVLGCLPSAIPFSDFALALAPWSLVLFTLAYFEAGSTPRADAPRWCWRAGISRSSTGTFHPFGSSNFSAYSSNVCGREFSAGTTNFESIYPMISLVLVLDAVLFIGPLFIFSSKLWACRVKGLSDYMELAADYVNDFDKKWLREDAPAHESLLGTADLQSLADLNNSMNVVSKMRWVPLSMRLLVDLAIAALLPMLPLLLLKYPVSELTKKLFTSLVGL
jgi:hypothetical protein